MFCTRNVTCANKRKFLKRNSQRSPAHPRARQVRPRNQSFPVDGLDEVLRGCIARRASHPGENHREAKVAVGFLELHGAPASIQQSSASVPEVKEIVGMSQRLQCACHGSERFLCGNDCRHILTLILLLVCNFVYGWNTCMLAILFAFSVFVKSFNHCNRQAYLIPCRRVGKARVAHVRRRRRRSKMPLKIMSVAACCNFCFSVMCESNYIRNFLSSMLFHSLMFCTRFSNSAIS